MRRLKQEVHELDHHDADLVEELKAELNAAYEALSATQRRIDLQLKIAAEVHHSLLPSPVRHPRIDVDVEYLPIDTVGGDYCQLRFPQPSCCYVTICDVAGHGIGPALLATRVSSEVRRYILDCLRPREMVSSLNAFVFDHLSKVHTLLTFLSARINLDARTITVCGAGHPPVLHLSAGTGTVQALKSKNLPIGVRRNCLVPRPECSGQLAPGDTLLFYTDGLTEAADPQGRQLGQSRFAQIAAEVVSQDGEDMAARIIKRVAEFRQGPPVDDMTLIVVRIK